MVDANHELGSNDYNNMCPLQYCADMSNSRKFKKMFKTSKVKSKARDDSYRLLCIKSKQLFYRFSIFTITTYVSLNFKRFNKCSFIIHFSTYSSIVI